MHRPKTRGELKNKLIDGIPCEVAEQVAEMTSILLKGWLNFSNFQIIKSKNKGWVIFNPTL